MDNKYDLAVLIPARNEMFLSKTVEGILKKKQGKTEVLVALDSDWANPQVEDHPDVTVVYFPESIGQRAATNQLARLTKAKYVMKLDAHCDLDEGFDVKLMADMQDDWTVIPAMYNFHAFDWVCIGQTPRSGELYVEDPEIKKLGCGATIYQGPTPDKCPTCSGNMERLLIWQRRESRRNEFYRFDRNLHFQYWGDFRNRPESKGDLAPSLSAQGSCFMLTREKYWELDICDEKHGSWGQQGTEVACKTWLSGGQLMLNKKTWYSHMFRTQGGDFGFPYPLSGSDVDKARKYSKELWIGNSWPKAKHDLNWLLDKFKPVPDWHDISTEDDLNKDKGSITTPTKGIIFYTDNQLNLKIAHAVQDNLKKIGLPIVSASLKPMGFGKNVHVPMQRGYLAMSTQILRALEASDAEIIYFAEHDVLYHPSNFKFIPPTKDKFYYNVNWWKVRAIDGFAVSWEAEQVSGLVAYRDLLVEHYRKRVAIVEKYGYNHSMGFEPGSHNYAETINIRDKNAIPKDVYIDDVLIEDWKSEYPNIDIRLDGTGKNNLSYSKWSLDDFRDKTTAKNFQIGSVDKIPGWNFPSGSFLI